MFYFFERNAQFIRCELRPGSDGFELIVVRHDGTEQIERFDSEEELTARWAALQQSLQREGWWGPHGRD